MFALQDHIKFCSLLVQEDLGRFWFSKFWNNLVIGIAWKKTDFFKTEPLTGLIKRFYDVIALAKDIATQEYRIGREPWFSFQTSVCWAYFTPFVLFLVFFLFLIRTCFLVFHCFSISACFITVAQLKFVLKPKFSDDFHCLPTLSLGQLYSWASSLIRQRNTDTFEFCLCRQYGCKPLEL